MVPGPGPFCRCWSVKSQARNLDRCVRPDYATVAELALRVPAHCLQASGVAVEVAPVPPDCVNRVERTTRDQLWTHNGIRVTETELSAFVVAPRQHFSILEAGQTELLTRCDGHRALHCWQDRKSAMS